MPITKKIISYIELCFSSESEIDERTETCCVKSSEAEDES